MNREKRIRDLRALIADPATFEGERATAREMLARLEQTRRTPEPRIEGRFERVTVNGTPVDATFWWDGVGHVPPMRAYGPAISVRDRMSDDPPPEAEAWARSTAVPLWHVISGELDEDLIQLARTWAEALEKFRRAAGDADGSREWRV